MEFSNAFVEANKKSLEIAKKIEEVLKFKGIPSLIPIINSHSLSLKLPIGFKQRNSTLCIDPKGYGKSTLLIDILAKSNPKYFQVLPKKIFESELVEMPKDYFHNKILVHDDLIAVLGGTSTKQRQQLTSFWTQLLADGRYSRKGKEQLIGVQTLVHFGIAWESYCTYHKSLLDSTFLDRFVPYRVTISQEQKMEILETRDLIKENHKELPVIKLKLSRGNEKISRILTDAMKKERNILAMQMEENNIMSAPRAHNYIDLFMMSNALFNERSETVQEDLELYKMIHRYHLESSFDKDNERKIRVYLVTKPQATVKEIVKDLGIPQATVYRIMKQLSNYH